MPRSAGSSAPGGGTTAGGVGEFGLIGERRRPQTARLSSCDAMCNGRCCMPTGEPAHALAVVTPEEQRPLVAVCPVPLAGLSTAASRFIACAESGRVDVRSRRRIVGSCEHGGSWCWGCLGEPLVRMRLVGGVFTLDFIGLIPG